MKNTSIHYTFLRYFKNAILIFVLLFLIPFVKAQPIQKKQLTPDHYGLWERVNNQNVSNNGEWISYSMHYTAGMDTLFVKNTKNGMLYAIPGGSGGVFSNKYDQFTYLLNGYQDISYLNLEKGKKTLVSNGSFGDLSNNNGFTDDGRYLSILKMDKKDQPKESYLIIKDFLKGSTLEIKNVSKFSLNRKDNQLVYIAQNESGHFVKLLDLDEGKESIKIVCRNLTNRYHSLGWDKTNTYFGFLESFKDDKHVQESNIVHQYNEGKLHSFDHRTHKDFPKNMYIPKPPLGKNFLISNDGKRVFFNIEKWKLVKDENEVESKTSNVEVWSWKDMEVYPKLKSETNRGRLPIYSVWWPTSSRFMQLTDEKQSEVFLSGNCTHALTFNPIQYRPLFKYIEDYVDIYITNLETAKKELFLKKQLLSSLHTVVSPEGKYISYFKDKNWWIYNIQTKTHINISKNLPHPTYKFNSDIHSRSPQPYGISGWTKDDKQIIVYDEFDIWLISPDGSSKKRITNGRSSNKMHRIYDYQYTWYTNFDFYGYECKSFNLNEDLILSTFGTTTKKAGYSSWNKKKGLKEITYGDKHADQLKKAQNKNTYIIREQRFDMPPKLMLYSKENDLKKEIVQSNPQHWTYSWGKSELIEYQGVNNDTLQGALFYPSNYQVGKKYSMVVDIYEKRSKELHHYINPSLNDMNGFNPSIYTTNGYFVLKPDINYEYNNPGMSAVTCVVSAVEKVFAMNLVNKNRIGLIGHSFGGYEASFIITQTDLFSAAVAGAAASVDILSSYLSFYMRYRSEAEFYENHQHRFTGSFWELKDDYLKNSPIHNLEKVNTPLLTWYGKKDARVNISQGIELYNAMRRLEKEHIFLVYPDATHVVSKPNDQIDLNKRILHWFDHKLKGVAPQDWIVNGDNFKN